MLEQDAQIQKPAYEQFDPKYGKRRGEASNLRGIFDRLLPTEVLDTNNNLERAESFLQEGRGLIVIMNHPSAGDHFRVAKTVFRSAAIKNSPISIAVAYHQYPRYIEELMGYMGVDAREIVTESTVAKRKNKLHPREFLALSIMYGMSKIPGHQLSERELTTLNHEWRKRNSLPAGHGVNNYLRSAGETLTKGGVVVLGPQGTRSKTLEPWRDGPVKLLLGRAKDKHNVGFLFLGIDERGGGKGINPGHEYGIALHSTILYEELDAFAKEQNISIDRSVFEKLNEAVRQAHRTSSEKLAQTPKLKRAKTWILRRQSASSDQF